jgi:hypothetical protein
VHCAARGVWLRGLSWRDSRNGIGQDAVRGDGWQQPWTVGEVVEDKELSMSEPSSEEWC